MHTIMDYKGYQDTDLIPDLQGWKDLNGEDFEIEDWLLGFHSTPELTIAYTSVFCPDFEEYNGGLFFKDKYNRHTMQDDIEKHHNGDFLGYQSFTNFREVAYFMCSSAEDVLTPKQVEFMGKLLERIWGYQLKAEFPHLNPQVKYCGLEVNPLEDANVTFWAQPKDMDKMQC